MGGTPSYHPFLDGIFPNKNHPAIGDPLFLWTWRLGVALSWLQHCPGDTNPVLQVGNSIYFSINLNLCTCNWIKTTNLSVYLSIYLSVCLSIYSHQF